MRLLREVWNDVEQHYFTFDIGLSFMSTLPIEEVKGLLRKRVKHLGHIVQYLDASGGAVGGRARAISLSYDCV